MRCRLKQGIPQYAEAPPNVEAKQISSYLDAVFSYSSNPLLLKDESKILNILLILADYLLLLLDAKIEQLLKKGSTEYESATNGQRDD